MAILKSGNLSFEIVFSDYDDADWVQYQFYFRWDDEPLVRDDLLKKQGPCCVMRNTQLSAYDSVVPAQGIEEVFRNRFRYWNPDVSCQAVTFTAGGPGYVAGH